MTRNTYLELPVTSTATAKAFYEAALGWSFTDFGPTYASTMDGASDVGLQADPAEKTAALLPVVEVDDLEPTLAAVESSGGTVTKPIFAFPGGRRFHFRDPDGHELAVMQAAPAPLDHAAISASLSSELGDLQDRMAAIDLLVGPSSPSDTIEFLVKKHEDIALRMDADGKHARAHIHLDYGRRRHVASYAIDTGERLVGDGLYDRAVKEWIDRNRAILMAVWTITRSSSQPDQLIARLKGSSF